VKINPPPEEFFDVEFREAYRRWQQREEKRDAEKTTSHNRLLIENGDHELEALVTALEQGWKENEGRS
jgi:hypothetical protein